MVYVANAVGNNVMTVFINVWTKVAAEVYICPPGRVYVLIGYSVNR